MYGHFPSQHTSSSFASFTIASIPIHLPHFVGCQLLQASFTAIFDVWIYSMESVNK